MSAASIRVAILGWALVTGLSCASPSGSDVPPLARVCETRADCEAKGEGFEGLVCGPTGQCEGCASSAQCGVREVCSPASRRCQFRSGWGDECTANTDCAAGTLCVQGLCVSQEAAILCTQGRCLVDGMRCQRANGVCEEDLGCLADSDCAETERCNLASFRCVSRCTEETVARDCARRETCYQGLCSECRSDADCSWGTVCFLDKLICGFEPGLRCTNDRDCQAGEICDRASSLCIPPPPPCLSNEECLPDERCDYAQGKCVRRACPFDRYEPNDTPEQAPQLAAGEIGNLTLCERVPDYFTLRMARGDRVSVFVDADAFFESAVETQLLSPEGRVEGTGRLALAATVASDADYRLRLVATDPFVPYGLRLTLSRGTPCDDDRYEPNDTPATATPIAGAQEITLLSLCGLDRDLFKLALDAGEGLRVAMLQEDSTAGAAVLVLRGTDGAELDRVDPAGSRQAVLSGDHSAMDALIEIRSIDGRGHALYRLQITTQKEVREP